MIIFSQDELQQIESQLKEIVTNVLGQAEGFISGAAVNPHWVSHTDAIKKLGWSKILLKRGVENGHLYPITIPGTGGTKYDLSELSGYKEFLMGERRKNRLDHRYISKANDKTAQSKTEDHVYPHTQSKRPAKKGLTRRSA